MFILRYPIVRQRSRRQRGPSEANHANLHLRQDRSRPHVATPEIGSPQTGQVRSSVTPGLRLRGVIEQAADASVPIQF